MDALPERGPPLDDKVLDVAGDEFEPGDVLLADQLHRFLAQAVPGQAEDLLGEAEHAHQVEALRDGDAAAAERAGQPADQPGLEMGQEVVGEAPYAAHEGIEQVADERARVVDDGLERLLGAPDEAVERLRRDPGHLEHGLEEFARERGPVARQRCLEQPQGDLQPRLKHVQDLVEARLQPVDQRGDPFLEAGCHVVDELLRGSDGVIDGLVELRRQFGEDIAQQGVDRALEELTEGGNGALDEGCRGVDELQGEGLDGIQDACSPRRARRRRSRRSR